MSCARRHRDASDGLSMSTYSGDRRTDTQLCGTLAVRYEYIVRIEAVGSGTRRMHATDKYKRSARRRVYQCAAPGRRVQFVSSAVVRWLAREEEARRRTPTRSIRPTAFMLRASFQRNGNYTNVGGPTITHSQLN